MIYLYLFLLIVILFSFAYAFFRSIGWVPMWSKDVDNVMELADLRPGEKFCDLGCGEGKVVVAAANQGAKAVGYEISILLYVIAKIRSWFSKGKVEIKFRDFWLVDLSDMDVVFFFLIPRIFPKMKEKLERELKPGSRVITYVWPMKGWKEERIIKRAKGPAIYLYNIK
jgi:SAM-dependent methyltransferase